MVRRPVDRAAAVYKKHLLGQVRAYLRRELREASDLKQVELAARLHVSENKVYRIEHSDTDRASVATLRKHIEAAGR